MVVVPFAVQMTQGTGKHFTLTIATIQGEFVVFCAAIAIQELVI